MKQLGGKIPNYTILRLFFTFLNSKTFMRNLVLFGPPGAGKGTQSGYIIQKYQLVHISTGDLFRKHLKEGTDLGKLAQKYMDEGKLVPDEVVIGMVEDKIKEDTQSGGFIFDGFPRTGAQAEALDKMLADNNLAISGMIALEVTEDELTARLLERGKTSNRPDDQDEKIIRTRVEVYNQETAPVAEFYKKQGKFHSIYGIGAIDDIFAKICTIIDTF
jgi:adenylate kinase